MDLDFGRNGTEKQLRSLAASGGKNRSRSVISVIKVVLVCVVFLGVLGTCMGLGMVKGVPFDSGQRMIANLGRQKQDRRRAGVFRQHSAALVRQLNNASVCIQCLHAFTSFNHTRSYHLLNLFYHVTLRLARRTIKHAFLKAFEPDVHDLARFRFLQQHRRVLRRIASKEAVFRIFDQNGPYPPQLGIRPAGRSAGGPPPALRDRAVR